MVICRIRVEKQNDTTKNGEKVAIVVEQTLKIVMVPPYEVRPSIPMEDGGTAMVNLRRKSFDVRMTRGGKPVANHPFQLTTDYVKGSGGHNHGETRDTKRVDNNDNYGYFFTDQDTTHRRPFDTLTNMEGRFSAITYSASIFGDTMRIILNSRRNKLLCDSINILEKVAGLELLPIGANYVKVGGTCAHHGPSDILPTTSPCQIPDNNHWCTPNFADSLQLAINKFYNWSMSEENGGVPIILYLNDMSLPLGGRFDISGRWEGRDDQEHYYHRNGTSVDISRRNGITEGQIEKLTYYMQQFSITRNRERPKIHYGFNEGN